MTQPLAWTAAEDAILGACLPRTPHAAKLAALPGRSIEAIKKRLQRFKDGVRAPAEPMADWPARDDELRAHVAAGLSDLQVATVMGLRKNQVKGRRKTIGLALETDRSKRRRGDMPRLSEKERKARWRATHGGQPRAKRSGPVPRSMARVQEPQGPRVRLSLSACRVEQCRWPFGHPGTAEFRFCTADAMPGRPYCVCHLKEAYLPPKETRRVVNAMDFFAPGPPRSERDPAHV